MSVLTWLCDLVGFGGFQGSPYGATETRSNARHGQEWGGIPCWTIPEELLCIFVGSDRVFYKRYPRLSGQWDFGKVAVRLNLIIEMLDFADDGDGEFGVRAMHREFQLRISLHDVMALAQNLEQVGILRRPLQRNRPRQLNRGRYDEWWGIAYEWLESEPESMYVGKERI